MRTVRVTIQGESYISLETVAECYECDVAWVHEVYDLGLLGRGRSHEGTIVVATAVLDRVATIRRLHVYQGLDLALVAAFLESDD